MNQSSFTIIFTLLVAIIGNCVGQYTYQGGFNNNGDGGRIIIAKGSTAGSYSISSDIRMTLTSGIENDITVIVDFVPGQGSATPKTGFPLTFGGIVGFETPALPNFRVFQVPSTAVNVASMEAAVASTMKNGSTDHFTLSARDSTKTFSGPLVFVPATPSTTNVQTSTTASPFTNGATTTSRPTTAAATTTTTTGSTTGHKGTNSSTTAASTTSQTTSTTTTSTTGDARATNPFVFLNLVLLVVSLFYSL
ncbi:hypothetical protein DFA_05646 [Cavenderia fasciculata]|uniref:Uncharacterized protein n=1 Tax=Cavenderia fasciculata TaxID=261658 RepID=F4PLV9_CACFS|nr:uncharacterized protein DFA_05646 [Cavenderia fasciculata]EGG23513.1 hypothetical protein DFA_05646 [Cavenderia fasciculata]|eukprot:XP_004361364.1 hypothetical protein DFA_05646 [Cavenderia fasciculata]